MNARINKILSEVGKVVIIVVGFYLLLCLYDCTRTKPKPEGKENVVKQTHREKADTVFIPYEVKVHSKPKTIIKWCNIPQSIINDTLSKISYCDSTTIQTDTITKEGVKLAILDTIRNNSVVGRQTQIISANQIITNTITDSIFTLRVDTVYIQKKRGVLCAVCFGAGFVIGSLTK